jgi:hypothetical protein
MSISFLNSFQSEWLKKKHSAGAWLTVTGGCFVPAIVLAQRLYERKTLAATNQSPELWEVLYSRSWQYMLFFLLPMGVILVTSLIAQLEVRNNAWKQLHTTPQHPALIFFAKLSVILVMLTQFFLLFNLGIYLTGVIPGLLFSDVPLPRQGFPLLKFLQGNSLFFLTCLPIVTLQYLLSLHFKNFLAPVGIGFGIYMVSMIAIRWKYAYLIPYSYSTLLFLGRRAPISTEKIYLLAVGYFALFGILNFILYINKKTRD